MSVVSFVSVVVNSFLDRWKACGGDGLTYPAALFVGELDVHPGGETGKLGLQDLIGAFQ